MCCSFLGGKTPDVTSRTFSHVMKEGYLQKDTADVRQQLQEKAKTGDLHALGNGGAVAPARKKGRWDVPTPISASTSGSFSSAATDATPEQPQKWSATPQQPQAWAATPTHVPAGSATPSLSTGVTQWDATPKAAVKRNRWDETPRATVGSETPNVSSWQETPRADRGDGQVNGFVDQWVHWLIDWLIIPFVDGSIDWLIDWALVFCLFRLLL